MYIHTHTHTHIQCLGVRVSTVTLAVLLDELEEGVPLAFLRQVLPPRRVDAIREMVCVREREGERERDTERAGGGGAGER